MYTRKAPRSAVALKCFEVVCEPKKGLPWLLVSEAIKVIMKDKVPSEDRSQRRLESAEG